MFGTTSQTSLFTNTASSTFAAASYQLSSTTGSYTDTYTVPDSQDWAILMAAFKAATSSSAATTTTRYLHTDHLGGTQFVSDATGAVIEAIDYYPYGQSRLDTKSGSYGGEKRKYIGEEYDSTTGLSYLNARYYSGTRGNFLSEDPIFLGDPGKQNLTDPQTLNSYSYANGNPVVNKDPSGKCPVCLIFVAGALGGLTSQAVEDYTSGNSVQWQNYVGAAAGGMAGAATLIASPGAGGYFAGGISQGVEQYATDRLFQETGRDEPVDYGNVGAETVKGLAFGKFADMVKVPFLNAGRNSLTATTKSMATRIGNGMESMAATTFAKVTTAQVTYGYANGMYNTMVNKSVSGLSAAQSAGIAGILSAFKPTNATQAQLIRNVVAAFGGSR